MFLGADPEFAIVDSEGKAISAHLAGIGGKGEKVSLLGDSGGVAPSYVKGRRIGTQTGEFAKYFRDGWMIEVNPRAELCRAYFLNNLADALHAISALPIMVEKGWSLSTIPSIPVEKEMLDTTPNDVRTFGCDPAFDAYREGAARTIDIEDGSLHYVRYAGGHMHFSHYDEGLYLKVFKSSPPVAAKEDTNLLELDNYPRMIKWLDRSVGLALAVIFGDEAEFQRRKYYGLAGEFRPQAYPFTSKTTEFDAVEGKYKNVEKTTEKLYRGLEYRTPGPQMWNHPAIAAAAYGVARWVLRAYKHLPFDPALDDDVRGAINEGKWDEAFLRRALFTVPGYWDVDSLLLLREWVKANRDDLGKLNLTQWGREAHASWDNATRVGVVNVYSGERTEGQWKDLPIFTRLVDRDGREL